MYHIVQGLFTIARIWEQPRCPPTDEWIKKMRCMYAHEGILLSHEKNKILPFAATWMDLEGFMLSEISQRKACTI